jgi:hypothetical protein
MSLQAMYLFLNVDLSKSERRGYWRKRVFYKNAKSLCLYKRMSKASLKVQYANLARLYMRACAVCCAELSINGEKGPVRI